VSKKIGRPLFYADRKMVDRLKLKAVPSVIRQNGRFMEVAEVKLPIGQTKAAGKAQHYRKGAP
jgi:conjugal transfer pilus assembly protein TraW